MSLNIVPPQCMLTYDPLQRITAYQALRHPYLEGAQTVRPPIYSPLKPGERLKITATRLD